jgi:hypothetical protein
MIHQAFLLSLQLSTINSQPITILHNRRNQAGQRSWFESLAVASPRISNSLGGGNHVIYPASHTLQPDSFIC